MRNWTDEQRSAVEAPGKCGDILVTAAAGSGKTSVLTGRVIRKITVEGCDIDRLLIVTFTRAAAAEMRERIEDALSELLSKDPFDKNLLRQRLLLKRAKICTIDSFCTEVLREHFQSLGISRDFRIIEGNEYSLLLSQTADELLEEYYEKGGDDFCKTADFFLTDRSDSQLKSILIDLCSFLSSYAFPEKWLKSAEEEISRKGDINLDIWGREAVKICRDDAEFACSIARYTELLTGLSDETNEKYRPAVSSDLAQFTALYELTEKGSYEDVRAFIGGITFGRAEAIKNAELDWLKDRIGEYRKKYKKIITKLKDKLFCFDSKTYIADRELLRPVTEMLIGMTRDLDARIYEKKIAENFLSFSDLGRLCVRVLARPTDNGLEITEAARGYAARFDEILIDEYQDTNEVQDMIFYAISNKNRFMVGDVKQSIYAFRDADPAVFANKEESFADYDGKKFPSKISLNANFRSRKGVTDIVNFIFTRTMTKELGGIEYGEGQELRAAAQYPETGESCIEIDLINARDTALNEAEFTARRIKQLVQSGYPVSDGKGGLRPVGYGDIAVLYRALNTKKASIMRAFANEGVKISMEASGGLFSTYEILSVMELLRAIDNPRRDLSLAAAMMGPAFGFTEDEAAQMRIKAGNRLCFYDAVRECAKTDPKAAAFLEELSELRTAAARYTTDEFIIHLYMKTGLKDHMRASRGGRLKAANLELLITHAKNFEETGNTGLSAFLRYIARVRENGGDSAMSSVCTGENDAVSIMTIHKSKGLEYPIVFIAGIGGGFNLMDANDSALLHKKLFFGSKIKSGELVRDTLPHAILHRIIAAESVSEELRVLYVAMTRAREKLILVAARDDIKNDVKHAAEFCITDDMTRSYSKSVTSMLGWVVAAILGHPDAHELRSILDADISVAETEGRLTLNIAAELPPAETEVISEEEKTECDISEQEMTAFDEKFSWVYPYASEQSVPTKMSVTVLSHEAPSKPPRPRFITSRDELTAAERGTATHLFMSLCDFSADSIEAIENELARLTEKRFITKNQADAVDTDAALAFLQSETGRLAANAECLREYGFEYEVDASEVASEYPKTARILVSGTADLIIKSGDRVVIVDYKTDRVSSPDELVSRYEKQLGLYEKALSPVFGGKIEKVIYSFALKQTVNLQ